MAAWIPALKAILPYVTQIVTAAIPVFTTRPDQSKAAEVIPKQIQELQGAVTRNTESLKVLADQLQQVITSVDAGALAIEREVRDSKRLAVFAIVVSLVAILVCIATWLH
jgi:hypothetical protein